MDYVKLSKFLSLVLRHKPDAIGLSLDEQGWTAIDELLVRAAAAGTPIAKSDLLHVVAASDKKRFSLSQDGARIRAAQGHSVKIELGLASQKPPDRLFHGTARRYVEAIKAEGLQPQARLQVHLSADSETAKRVGQRHGEPVIFAIDAAAMALAGYAFFLADNGVWLTDHVPPSFLTLPD